MRLRFGCLPAWISQASRVWQMDEITCWNDVFNDHFGKGKSIPFGKLPGKVLNVLVQQMSKADPQATTISNVTCPVCSHKWQITFDIVSYFWTEIEVWAKRMLRDIHVIASAYGWSEREILQLTPRRRQYYLQMIYR